MCVQRVCLQVPCLGTLRYFPPHAWTLEDSSLPFKWPGAVVDTTTNSTPPFRSPPNQTGSRWLHVTSETEQVPYSVPDSGGALRYSRAGTPDGSSTYPAVRSGCPSISTNLDWTATTSFANPQEESDGICSFSTDSDCGTDSLPTMGTLAYGSFYLHKGGKEKQRQQGECRGVQTWVLST